MSDKPMIRPERVMKAAHAPWMLLALGLAVAPRVGVAREDVVARNSSESDDDFMVRVLGGSAELVQKVIRTTVLANGKVALIGFVAAEDGALVGHLLIETATGRYRHVQFPSCDVNGGMPNLLAVFFARTAKDGGRDLAVLCSWDIRHLEVSGTDYSAEFYRLKDRESDMAVEPLAKLNKKFETSDLVYVDERRTLKAKFKTVAEVKKLLTKMGLRQ
jgi:hypothetical protein